MSPMLMGISSRLLACVPFWVAFPLSSRSRRQAWLRSLAEFPALNGQSVSYAVLEFPAGTTNPPHTHPRASELLFLTQGTLQVGFVDTTNKLFNKTLQAGDVIVFPKGLVHFQYNDDVKFPAIAISAFVSANAGTVSLPNTLFATGIDDNVLAKSFKTNIATIKALKAGLAPQP